MPKKYTNVIFVQNGLFIKTDVVSLYSENPNLKKSKYCISVFSVNFFVHFSNVGPSVLNKVHGW